MTANEFTERMHINDYYSAMALLASKRATCRRRQVGCVIVDANNRVISIGYNGNTAGVKHCLDQPCLAAGAQSGSDLDGCEAIHAEISALGVCRDIFAIDKIYVTVSPCVSCTKSLLATPCKTIIFAKEYPHLESKVLWKKANRNWIHWHYEPQILTA